MDEFFEKQPWLHCQNSFDDDQVQLPRMPPNFDRRKGAQRIHSLHFGRQKNLNLGQGTAEKTVTDLPASATIRTNLRSV